MRWSRLSLVLAVLATAAGLGAALTAGAAAARSATAGIAANPCGSNGAFTVTDIGGQCTYSAAGTGDTFTVPAGVTSLSVQAIGAQGGSNSSGGGTGGAGAYVANSALPVPAGTSLLYVDVGSPGFAVSGTTAGGAGWPDGGTAQDNGAGGGGSSSVSTAPSGATLTGNAGDDPRPLVAGGGGGTSGFNRGGPAGNFQVTGGGSGGCSGAGGGAGGIGPTDGSNGGGASACQAGAGSAGQGGYARYHWTGGGGGGGWFGGGGGSQGAGGGGSSYAGATVQGGATTVSEDGNDPPSVTITYATMSKPASLWVRVTPDSSGDGDYTVTAKALDASGRLMTGYTGPHGSWSDANAAVTSPSAPSDFVDGVSATTGVQLSPTRRDVLDFTTYDGQVTGQSNMFTVGRAASAYAVHISGPESTSQSSTVTLDAIDSAGNIDTSYAGTASVSDAAGAVTAAPVTFSSGVAQASVSFTKAARGDQITATDANTPSITGQSLKFNVLGPVSGFAVKVAGPVSAGGQAQVTATAIDTAGNTITSYAGPAIASDGTSQQTLALSSFSGGVASGQLSFPNAAKADHVTVTDNGNSSISGRSLAFAVVGQPASFAATVTGPVSAGTAATLTVTALDSAGNIATSYAGSPAVSDSDSDLTGTPTLSGFQNGIATGQIAFTNDEAQDRVQVGDGGSAIFGQSAAFHVLGSVNRYRVLVTRLVRAGHPTTLTVDALDSAGNTITTYGGQNASWQDSGGQITPSQPLTFTNGSATAQITLPRAAQNDTITVTDDTNQSASSTSLPFNVYGRVSAYEVSVPSTNSDATNVPLTVTAVDSAGNTILGYSGTANATDSQNALNNSPVQLTFTKGVATAPLSFASAESSDTITATSTTDQTVTGTSQAFAVTATSPLVGHVESDPLSYQAGDSPAAITNTLTLTDATSGTIQDATVAITSGFDSGYDILEFTNSGNITGSYNAATGVLSLYGTASLADYQAALRLGGVLHNGPVRQPGRSHGQLHRDRHQLADQQHPVAHHRRGPLDLAAGGGRSGVAYPRRRSPSSRCKMPPWGRQPSKN